MKRNYIIIIILISLVASFMSVYERIRIESNNKGVEIVLDYEEINKLSDQSDKDLLWWFREFKKLGITSVALKEETLASMANQDKDIELHMYGNIVKDLDWKEKYDYEFVEYLRKEAIDKYDLVVITKSKEIYDFIIEGLSNRYPKNLFKAIIGEKFQYIILDGDESEALFMQSPILFDVEGKLVDKQTSLYSSKLAYIGLGYDKEKINLIQNSGLNVLPRPINYAKYSKKLVEAFKNDLKKYNIKPSVLIFAGKEILGYEDSSKELIQYMKENNISVGLIETAVQREHIEQQGINELVRALDYNAVRVFSVWPYIQTRYKYYNYKGAEEIGNTLYRAVTERNIRLIYFKPFKEDKYKYVTEIEEYQKMFNRFKQRIQKHGISIQSFTVMKSNNVGKLKLSLIGFGLVIAGSLLINNIVEMNKRIENIILLLGIVFTIVITNIIPTISEKIFALAASIIFPSLSIQYFVKYCKNKVINYKEKTSIFLIIKSAAFTLLTCILISLIGGLIIAAILSDIEYLLEMDIFRGVKLSQITPLVLFCIIYIVSFGYKRDKKSLEDLRVGKKEFIKLLNQDIMIKHVLAITIFLVMGYIYIARTGHETSIQPSDLEMIFRNFLEEVLLARPRTKEFLLAFPSLMITVYMAFKGYKKFIFPFALVAVVGLTSIVNTFSHLRTPIYLSLIRTFYSAFFGVILGIIAILLLNAIESFFISLKGEK